VAKLSPWLPELPEIVPTFTTCCRNTVLRSITPRKSKPAQYFHYIVCITELRYQVSAGPWSIKIYRPLQSSRRGP